VLHDAKRVIIKINPTNLLAIIIPLGLFIKINIGKLLDRVGGKVSYRRRPGYFGRIMR